MIIVNKYLLQTESV